MMWLRVAWRDLWRQKRRSIHALLIVALCTAAYVLIAGYVLAAFAAVRDSVIHSGVGHLQIATSDEFAGYEEHLLENGLLPTDVMRIRQAAHAIEHVSASVPRLAFQGLVVRDERSVAAMGEGVDPMLEKRLPHAQARVVAGNDIESSQTDGRYGALVGQEMARLLGVETGDLITVHTISRGGARNTAEMRVAGLISTGSATLDRMRLVIPLAAAQELLRTERIRKLVVALDDHTHTNVIAQQLAELLPDLEIRTWRDFAPSYNQLSLSQVKQFGTQVVVIATVVLLTIFTCIALGAQERTREIRTMLSMGFPRQRIQFLFCLEGALLGVTSGLAGISLGYFLCVAITNIQIEPPATADQTTPHPLVLLFAPEIACGILLLMLILSVVAGWMASCRVTARGFAPCMARGQGHG